jgi:response regulator RpfG family c-di-GMP phosphodiesterase
MEQKNKQYKLFTFTPEIMQQIAETKEIPVHFYNKEGQIVIYKKKNATEVEIDRLFRYTQQGTLYYDVDDSEALGIKEKAKDIPEGFTDTKLLTEKNAIDLTQETKSIFSTLKKTAITSIHTRKTSEKLTQVFKDFESNPDSLTGLINIIELLRGKDYEYEIELATKRVVVAMAMKTRGISAQYYKEDGTFYNRINHLMMSALLCDIGYAKMNIPDKSFLDIKEMNYIKSHPILSYLLIAHEPSIHKNIKRNVLVHHRPMRYDINTNNYPNKEFLIKKLKEIQQKFASDPKKHNIVEDIEIQLKLLKEDLPYDEDAAILCIASEFASLTSKVPWRNAFSSIRAVQMIVNNSYFTYPDRTIREFLDHTAISLCDNKKAIREGDFVVMTCITPSGKTYFEAGQVTNTTRYQSRPGIDRIATVQPIIKNVPKLNIAGFDLDNMIIDKRFAHFELLQDDSRKIIYIVNPDYDEQLYEAFYRIIKGKYSKRTFIEKATI